MQGTTTSRIARSQSAGFTLVELLVVIGIIALLISILLPALNAARRQASQTKCAAQMKQMYNAFLFYAGDHKGMFPPVRISLGATFVNPTKMYTVSGVDFPVDTSGSSQSKSIYYYDFAAKYLTKTKTGVASTNADEADQARRSVIWACPAWEPYAAPTQISGVNRSQTGIGMNIWPSMTPTNPAVGTNFPAASESAWISNLGDVSQAGSWYNATKWGRQSAARALLADANQYLVESKAAPADGSFPPQPANHNLFTYTTGVAGQTTVSVYRHGKVPNMHPSYAGTFSEKGGKVAYNILYADGHVTGENDQKAAYLAPRQRYPG